MRNQVIQKLTNEFLFITKHLYEKILSDAMKMLKGIATDSYKCKCISKFFFAKKFHRPDVQFINPPSHLKQRQKTKQNSVLK